MQMERVIKLPDNPYGSSKNGCSARGPSLRPGHYDLTRAQSHYKIRGQGRRSSHGWKMAPLTQRP